MARLWDLNLIRFFEFYLTVAFLASTAMRFRQYEAVVRLVRAVPERWPRLLKLVKEHHGIFLTWATVLPAVLALGLCVLHTFACRLVWPHAELTVSGLFQLRLAVPIVALLGIAMLVVDLYATFTVGQVDRSSLERYFDQAEYWLRSWVAPVVRVFTLGYVNPRRLVTAEVRKALAEANRLLNVTLWWVSGQVGLRIAFGLSLWLTYAFS
jgi:ABC-type proline/glycine betaine transport system permease subunit